MIRQKTVIDELGKIQSQLVHTNYKQSKPPGRRPKLPYNGQPQQRTDRRFMSRYQREAFDKGKEIWV